MNEEYLQLLQALLKCEDGAEVAQLEANPKLVALDIYTRKAFPLEWARIQRSLAGSYFKQHIQGERGANQEKSIRCYQLALEVFSGEAFPVEWARTQMDLAVAYRARIWGKSAENLEESIYCCQLALEVFNCNTFPVEWASTQNNLAAAYLHRSHGDRGANLEDAIHCCQLALEIRTRENYPVQWASTQTNLAVAYFNRIRGERAANLEKSISLHELILEIRTHENYPIEWARTQTNLAVAYSFRTQGKKEANLEESIRRYQLALEVYTREDFHNEWAKIQNNLAIAYSFWIGVREEANLEESIRYYQLALEVYTHEDSPSEWARIQMNLAVTYRNRITGEKAVNLRESMRRCQLALEVYNRTNFPEDWAMAQSNLADVYKEIDRVPEAIKCYQSSLEIFTPELSPLNCLKTSRSLGNLSFEQSNWVLSIDAYRLAIQAVETSRIWAVNPQRRQEILSAAINVYHKIVQSYINLDRLDRALEYVERSKARNLVELITNKNLKPQGIDQVNIDRLDELRQAVVNEQIRLQDRASKQNLISSDNLTPYVHDYSHLQEYQKALDEFIDREITPIDPTFKLTQKVEPIPFKDIQALTDTETCLVQWYITNDNILAFVITSESLHVWQSTKEALQNLLDWKDAYLKAYEQNKAEWIKTLDDRLDRLSAILQLDEIVNLIPKSCNKLILVPHYFLHIFPLHTLPLKNGKFLYECFPQGIGYAPSCQLLKLTQESKAERHQEFNNLFAIQNPKRTDTKPLLGANLEITQISQHFDLQNSTIIAESQASENMLVELKEKIKSTHCLHFSCHGKFNPKSPLDSALLLADPEGNLGASANLTLAEIFEKIDLQQCRLVTLSACESGVVDPTIISDEYIGIPSGFIFAGSLSVVSTLWTVDPLATTLFMTKFYRNLQQTSQIDGVNVILAANKAQIWLRNLSSKKLARIKDSQRFQQLLTEIFHNQKRDYKKFNDLLEAAVKREPYPFANPYYWTAFTATGI
jgi:CHAT domain-containing protein/TPR repeat protein